MSGVNYLPLEQTRHVLVGILRGTIQVLGTWEAPSEVEGTNYMRPKPDGTGWIGSFVDDQGLWAFELFATDGKGVSG
jgi:hypothetical protein